MAGQPTISGITYFDVSSIRALETDPTAVHPENIIREGTSFDIEVEFNGDSVGTGGFDSAAMLWAQMRDTGTSYTVQVFIESIGAGFEGLLAETAAPVPLTLGQDNYTVTLSVPGGVPVDPSTTDPLETGLYNVGVMVRLSGGPAASRYLGYAENLFVEIAPGA